MFEKVRSKASVRASAAAAVLWKPGFGAASPGPVADGPEAGAARRIGGRARRHRPETGTPSRRRSFAAGVAAAGVAAALLLFALAAGLAVPAQAQTVETLVSNLGQTQASGASSSRQAQPFTTGSNGAGYSLTSVVLRIAPTGLTTVDTSNILVRIFETDSSGRPTSVLHTLSNPSTLTTSIGSSENNTFTAPAGATLMANTTYAVVVSGSDGTSDLGGMRLARTAEDDEDSGKAAGWSIANNRFSISSGSWSSSLESLMIRINGIIIVPNATGKPEITGVPQVGVGQTLTATIGTITDGDGLPTFPDDFDFQWVRVSGSTETNVGSNSASYVPMPADVGKTLKVKVTFTDNIGAPEGPLESDATAKVAAAPRPCPAEAAWCTTMTVASFEVGNETQTGLFGSAGEGSIEDDTIEYGTDGTTYSIEDLYFIDAPGTSDDQLLLTFDGTQFLPRGIALLLGGRAFTLDASSETSPAGTYSWSRPNGFGWIGGQKVTVGFRFPPDIVTIARATDADRVYGTESIGFVVNRANNTVGPLAVDVVLTDGRGHLPESELSRTITIADGSDGSAFYIQPDQFKDLNDGAWTFRPGTITGKVVKRSWYRLGSPSSFSVKMHYATTVGVGPFTSSFRVDEGTPNLDVTFYASTGEGMGAPTQRVHVQYSTAPGTATSPEDFTARSGSFYFEPENFKCLPAGYDGCVLSRDDHRAMKTVTLTDIIKNDNDNEGNETFRVVLQSSTNNPKSVVYVDDRGVRGVSCTPGSTCAAEITIVDNDNITGPTEHPDWTLEGSDRTFAGTSSNRPPGVSGTESAARCLDGHKPFRLLNQNGNRLTSGIEYSLRRIPGSDVAQHADLPKPSEMPTQFTIDDKGQIRTVVGKNYLHYTDSVGQLRYTDVIVRALQTSSNRYAEYRLGFNVIHPDRTDKLYLINCDDDSTKSPQAPLTGQVQNAPDSHDGSTAFSFRILFSEDVDIEPDALRDDAIKVSHATVTGAARVDGRDDLWEVTLTPKATQAISIQLRGQLECTQDAAICTANGKKLAANVVHSVAYEAPGTRGTRSPTDPPALTASFENAPSSHDGSNAFTMELAFSEAVFEGTEDFNKNARVRSALSVTGGTLANFRRTDPAVFDRWTLRIDPAGNGDVTVTLPETTSCSATNAICTPGGTALSGDTTATIEGPGAVEVPQPTPLTASFANVPSSHDGSNAFTMELAFSEAVFEGTESFNKNARVRSALSVTGGTLANFRRTDPAVFDRWTLRINPAGNGNVTVSLPPTSGGCSGSGAICTPGGTPLTGITTATIQGPPGLAVADAEVEEASGAALAFAVTLSRASASDVTVDYATSDGSALAGVDYTATSDTLTFAAGETAKTVTVAVIDDDHNEGSETLTLTLSNASGGNAYIADGTATGTITNDDLMPQAWLARFGRTVADQVIDAVEGRMAAARTGGTELTLGGQRIGSGATAEDDALDAAQAEAGLETLTEWLRGAAGEEEASALTSRTVSGRELLSGSSFAFGAGTAESGFGALWGRGAVSRFDGREGDVTLDGEVESALLGADFTLGRGTAGLVVAHSLGEGGYRSPNGEGAVASTLTGLYPWGRYEASESLAFWGVVGYGTGSLTLTPADQAPIETDMGLTMAALGLRSVLTEAPPEGGLELSLTSDALAVRTTSDEVRGSGGNLAASEADVTRLRLGLEGTWRGLGTLVPTLEVGARHDGGDAETGFGADIGGRLVWDDAALGIRAELAARGLLTHQDGSLSERGFAGSLAWDPSPDSERGPALTLRQAVGAQASGGMDALLRPETARVLEAANEDGPDRRRLEARLGYGFALFGGGWTGVPEVGFGLTETGREYIHAWRLLETRDAGLVFGLDVEGARWESAVDETEPEHRVGLGFGWELKGARREDLELRFEASRLLPANDDPESRIGVRLTARW